MPPNKRLRASQVKPITLKRYATAVTELDSWANSRRCSLAPKHVDANITRYLHEMCESGSSIIDARSVVYGFILLRCQSETPERFLLPQAKQALKGWATRFPTHSKAGVDLQVWDTIAWKCIQNDSLLTAAGIMLQGDTYARPSELLRITRGAVIRPRRSRSHFWGIVIDPQEQHTPTKTGEYDDCVLLDSPGREGIAVILKYLFNRTKLDSDKLFAGLSLTKYNEDINQACKELGLQKLKLTAHVLRHSGPSTDSYRKIRSLDLIQSRGRWKALSSMHRYRKPGRMLLLHQLVPEHIWQRAPKARQKVIQTFA